MERIQIVHGSDLYRDAIDLRYRILREPLGLGFTDEQLAEEATDFHLGLLSGDQLVAALVLTPLNAGVVKMRQVAVESGLQGQGLGRELVAFSEAFAVEEGFAEMVLNARDTAVPFYRRLGYESVGEPFEEVTIPHLKMRRRLG